MRRQIDPRARLEQTQLERLGWTPPSELQRRIERLEALVASPSPPLLAITLGPWYRHAIGATGAGLYTAYLGTPSSTTAWGMTTNGRYIMPWPGDVVAGWIWSSAARTAGSATLVVRVEQGAITTDYWLSDCALADGLSEYETSRNIRVSGRLEPPHGIPIAAGDHIRVAFDVSANWSPTTANFGATLLFVAKSAGIPGRGE